jgi:inorganic pyrophosphatase
LNIIDFFSADDKAHWLSEIKKSDWGAGKYLYELLRDQKLKELCGEWTRVLLLVDDESLVSFCTYAEQDDVREPSLTPWVGFVYTFPEYRGKRRIGKLIEYIYRLAKNQGFKQLYISTDQKGLYENFGFSFLQTMTERRGGEMLVYQMEIAHKDYSDIIGKTVKGTIDRPLGSSHPRHKEMIYPINYGYVDGLFAGDGAEQDVYVFGTNQPLKTYEGKIIGVYHRLNDVEDKWIVALDDRPYSDQEILEAISFQEQYFMGELYR